MTDYPLNIAVIVEDIHLPAWQAALLRRLSAQAHTQIKLVLLADQPRIVWSLNPIKFRIFKKIRDLEVKFLEATHPADQPVNISGLLDSSFVKLNSAVAKVEYFNKAINLVINLTTKDKLPEYLIANTHYGVWYYFYNIMK